MSRKFKRRPRGSRIEYQFGRESQRVSCGYEGLCGYE